MSSIRSAWRACLHAGVREVAIFPLSGDAGALIGALVEGDGLDPAALRALAALRLPPWCRPQVIEVVSEIPRHGAGKIDREACIAALRRASGSSPVKNPAPARVKPGDPLEIMLADIWADVLGRRPLPVAEPFAALGGSPAQAARMIERVEHACDVSWRAWPRWPTSRSPISRAR